jgi:transposase InsO family protein
MASLNISGTKHLFKSLRRCAPFNVNMADDGVVEVSQVGTVELHINVTPEQTISILIDEVYYHERFSANLLSLHWLTQHGWGFGSSKDETFLLTPDKLKVRLNKDQRVSILRCSSGSGGASQGANKVYSVGELIWSSSDDLVRLHERLGHIGFDRMVRIIKAETTVGLGKLNVTEASLKEARQRVSECRACNQGKGTRTAFGHRGIDKGSAPGETLHMDTYYVKVPRADGTMAVEYGLTVSDPHTTFRWFGHLLSKDQGAKLVVEIIRLAEKQCGLSVKRIHSDGGTEFINQTVKAACAQLGIAMHWGPRATPELNSVAERQVRSSKDAARTLLIHAGLPARFWARAVSHAGYIWNRSNIAPATGMTPWEAVFKRKPSLEHLSVFGCDCYFHIPKEQRDAFDAKMMPGIYLGHSMERSCAIVYDLRSGQEVLTRDVQFLDRRFTHAAALVAGGEKLDAVFAMDFTGDNSPAAGGVIPRIDFGAQEFEVERIVGKRKRNGRTEYRVKWMGYGDDDISWEPADYVEQGAQDAIGEFEAQQLLLGNAAAPALAPQPQAGDPAPVVGPGHEPGPLGPAPAQPGPGAGVVEPAAARPSDAVAAAPAAAQPAVPNRDQPLAPESGPAAVVPAEAPAAVPAVLPRRSPRGNASSASVDAMAGHHRVHMAVPLAMEMIMSAMSHATIGGDDRLCDPDEMVYTVASGLSLLEDQTPRSWKEAMASPDASKWKAAMDKEFNGCEEMVTWVLVPRSSVPKWQIIVPCKWVFKYKVNANGEIESYRARLTQGILAAGRNQLL